MGVLTSANRIPTDLFHRIEEDSDNLDIVIYHHDNEPEEYGMPEDWEPESFSFDKAWEDVLWVLGQCGYQEAANLLRGAAEIQYRYHDCWVRSLTPAKNRAIAEALEGVTFEELKEQGLEQRLTNYDGREMSEHDYRYVVGDVDEMRTFFREAGEAGDYVILVDS